MSFEAESKSSAAPSHGLGLSYHVFERRGTTGHSFVGVDASLPRQVGEHLRREKQSDFGHSSSRETAILCARVKAK
jgi:hypothetical protein